MKKPLLRVTQLEKFRRYLSGDYDYETEQDVIDTITGDFKGNAYTYVGTAFHRIVEGNTDGVEKAEPGERHFLYYGKDTVEPVPEGRTFDIDGNKVTLDIPQCKVALAYKAEHPQAFHEIRQWQDFGDAVVTGCSDIIDGLEIRDIKTKYSAPDDKDYLNSCQWRYYLELFGADTFHFDIFIFQDYKPDKHGTDVRGLTLTRHTPPITCHRYPGMEDDNRHLLGEFIDWARFRKLTDKIPLYNGK